MKKLALLSTLAAIPVLASGCGLDKQTEPFKDSAVSARDNTPARVIEMPDGFSNVSAKCDGPNMVYVVFHYNDHYGALSVVPNDPRCRG